MIQCTIHDYCRYFPHYTSRTSSQYVFYRQLYAAKTFECSNGMHRRLAHDWAVNTSRCHLNPSMALLADPCVPNVAEAVLDIRKIFGVLTDILMIFVSAFS